LVIEDEACDGEVDQKKCADSERRSAHHAEEAQRTLREANQEEDAEQVQRVMCVNLGAIDSIEAIQG